MKKLFTISIIAIAITQNTHAQLVTISETYQLPIIGDSIRYVNTNSFGFDAAGTGPVTAKIWDFSTLMSTGTTVDFVYVDPTTIPVDLGRDSFPTANIARRQSDASGYFYYNNTTNNINRLGWFGSTTNYGIYKNGTIATEFQFPITAGQNFSSVYNGNFAPFNVGEDSVRITEGSVSIIADMQGQLTLPTGIFINVLRIHVQELFHIRAYLTGIAVTDDIISDDYYYWFTDTISQPIMVYGITTVSGTPQAAVLRYQPIVGGALGINNNLESFESIYPNPTNTSLTIAMKNPNASTIEIFNTTGSIVFKDEFKSLINISQLTAGVYFLKIMDKNGNILKIEKIIKE